MVFDVATDEFDQRVVGRSQELPVVVDFWAEWCGPCRQLGPTLERAAAKREGKLELAKVDVDANQALATGFGVQGIPAVKAFRDSKVVDEFVGNQPPAKVEEFFDRLVPSEVDELLETGDEDSLRRAVELDPQNAKAAGSLARKLIARGETVEAERMLAPVKDDFLADGLLARLELAAAGESAAPSERLPAAFAAWDAEDPGEALELLQEEMAEAADPERRDLVRRVMVSMFTELGPAHPLASEHRRRLAAALH